MSARPDSETHSTEADELEYQLALELARVARRARWIATGTGALLAAAGLAAAVLRALGAAGAPVALAYASGAALCALAAVLGSRGRTRRALWLMVAGATLMALGDQFD
ncbi:hypothetical protein OK074_0591 [Actinobacteria bacterium OK074]|nr:hypothetical protein OK074_0591 [Actinobacteria bacterium OK074]